MKYKPTIGLEIHVELKTKSKMFCGCLNETWKIGLEDLDPNKNTCPVCLAHPGTLPVINMDAVKMVIKAGLALNCKIRENLNLIVNNIFIQIYLKVIKFHNMTSLYVKMAILQLMEKKLELHVFI